MMMPCFITDAYAFSTTRVSEFVCALRRMRVPESVAIPCMVVIRFLKPTSDSDMLMSLSSSTQRSDDTLCDSYK